MINKARSVVDSALLIFRAIPRVRLGGQVSQY
jgi:hypothetical protein